MLSDGETIVELHVHDDMVWHCVITIHFTSCMCVHTLPCNVTRDNIVTKCFSFT